MKKYMSKFTDLGDDSSAIEELFNKLYNKFKNDDKKMKELYDILENQMWRTWKDKSLNARVSYLYKRLMDKINQ